MNKNLKYVSNSGCKYSLLRFCNKAFNFLTEQNLRSGFDFPEFFLEHVLIIICSLVIGDHISNVLHQDVGLIFRGSEFRENEKIQFSNIYHGKKKLFSILKILI